MRESDGIGESVDEARRYVTEAVDLLAPFADRPAAVALQGASRHLVESLTPILAGA